MKRRERTRQLIEFGGLLVKSGLVELTNDDRAALYGALLELVFLLQPETREQTIAVWRRSGSRAFREEMNEREQQTLRASQPTNPGF